MRTGLVAAGRHERTRVHDLYRYLGFEDWGRERRVDGDTPVSA